MFSNDKDDLLIEAYAPLEGCSGFRRAAFKASMIDYLIEIDDKVSCIVLKSGGHIPTLLSFDALKSAVYEPDFRTGSSIDLTLVTGAPVVHVKLETIARAFDTQEDQAQKPLEIRAILRRSSSNEFVIHVFKEADVAKFDIAAGSRAKEKQSVAVYFNKAAKTTAFIASAECLQIDMKHDDFMAELTKAKQERRPVLDLVELFASNPKKYGFIPG